MANTANNILTTNFNVTPYYDDYDETKGYYRILYKPGFAVQGRELTQMQTILQKQVDRFGKHIFREGSIVLPEDFVIRQNIEKVDYVKIKDVDVGNNDVTISSFLNKTLICPVTNVTAYVVNVADGSSSNTNTKTLYVRYLSSSNTNSDISTFRADDILSTNTGSNVVVLPSASTPVGQGTRFILKQGVLFAKEHFIRFEPTSAIISRYNTTPTCRVGFNILEEIVNYVNDSSLLDPALEASNYSAPGADRLKLTPILQVRDFNDTEGAPNFVELFSMKDGVLTEAYDRPQYNILRDELAKRTFDESGDYYVNGLTVRVREHLDNNVNGGYSNTGNSELLAVGVEPGTAYVKGYEVGVLTTEYVTTEKSNTYANVSGQVSVASMGNYIIANEFMGSLPLDEGALVYLYPTAAKRVTNKQALSGTPAGAAIGTARVLTMEYYNGTLGTNTANIALYLTDIRMNGTNSFAQTKTIYRSGFWADPVLEGDAAILKESSSGILLYSAGSPHLRSLHDTSDSPSLVYTYKKSSTGQSITNKEINFPFTPSEGESLNIVRKTDVTVTLESDVDISTGLTVTGTEGTNVLTRATGTTSFNNFNVGDKVKFQGNTNYFRITSINTSTGTEMTVDTLLPAGVTGNTLTKSYRAGDVLDLNVKGFDGLDRTVTVASNTLKINLQESITSTTATISYNLVRSNVEEIQNVLVSNVYVKLDMSAANSAPLAGPIGLGLSDIYKVRKILRRSDSTMPSGLNDTSATDVTSYFTIDNGQRDTIYDHGSITPTGVSLSSTDRLLVVLDYFEPNFTSGRGYFSVDSYTDSNIGLENIPIYTSPATKIQYDLRNFIDFRPVKAKTAAAATVVGDATVNPAISAGFAYESGKTIRFPITYSQLNYDFSYYLARRDIVVIDRNGLVNVIKGNPGTNPLTPTVSENVMALASLYIAPYPSLAPNYAQIINRKDLSVIVKKLSNVRFTMRDIGVLRDRIVNLEYYASLTTLEKSAIDMQIVDENNQNRFKNGIFVDTFRDHSLGDINDPNYRIVVDNEEKSLRPIYNMRSHYYDLKSNTNLMVSSGLVHLPYQNTLLIEQPKVTSFRNVEAGVYRFLGNLYLTPDIDVWVDTQQLADNQVVTGADPESLAEPTTPEFNLWQQKIVGYKLYKKSTGELLATFDASQKDLAYNNAYWLARNVEFNKNTIGLKNNVTTTNINIFGFTIPIQSYENTKFESIVETIYEENRTGHQTFSTISEDTQQLGNKVVDVSIQSYIRPQIIAGQALGMKASTKLFVFFDGEDMSSYVTPVTKDQHDRYVMSRTLTEDIVGLEGTSLVSNEEGNAYFLLRLPSGDSKRFRVGQKEVVVIDSPTKSEADASTLAKNYFVAEGLTQYKQNTILTTRTVITTEKEVSETRTTTSQFIQKLRPSCSAYSFIPKAPDGEEGVFLTKVDLFFQQKHPTLGFWIEIREMDSGGDITRNQVPLSEVWIESNDPRYLVSDDASLATVIEFPAPVFLYNNVQYALVIHTIGLNPDTYIWTARLTEPLLGKPEEKYSERPLTGTFFETNNNLNWTPVRDVDLKVNFYRAAFTKNVEGNAILGQKPIEKLVIENPSNGFDTYGETIVGNQRLTLSGGTISTLSVAQGDWLVSATGNAKVLSYNSPVANVSSVDFAPTQVVYRWSGATSTNTGQFSTIQSIEAASARLEKFRTTQGQNIVELGSSNGKFYVGDVIRGLSSNTTANVVAIQDFRYSLIDFEPAYIKFNRNEIVFEMSTLPNNSTSLSGFIPIDDNENYYFINERRVLSRSNEVALIGGGSSNNVKVRMVSASEYVSPILDLAKTHTIYVDNMINSNTYQETYTGITLKLDNEYANTGNIITNVNIGPTSLANSVVLSKTANTVTIKVPQTDYAVNNRIEIFNNTGTTSTGLFANIVSISTNYARNSGGAMFNRYISRPIVLAEGQDAEDILVVLTAYRPPNTDVPVWIKIQNNQDSDPFSSISWIKLDMFDSSVYSSSADRNDFKEYTYKFPLSMMTAPNPQLGAVQYTNSQGIKFTGFKTFAIKIGLLSDNSAIVPRVADLRTIALQI